MESWHKNMSRFPITLQLLFLLEQREDRVEKYNRSKWSCKWLLHMQYRIRSIIIIKDKVNVLKVVLSSSLLILLWMDNIWGKYSWDLYLQTKHIFYIYICSAPRTRKLWWYCSYRLCKTYSALCYSVYTSVSWIIKRCIIFVKNTFYFSQETSQAHSFSCFSWKQLQEAAEDFCLSHPYLSEEIFSFIIISVLARQYSCMKPYSSDPTYLVIILP